MGRCGAWQLDGWRLGDCAGRSHDVLESVHHRFGQREPAVLQMLYRELVRIVREVGRGTAGEVADGKADLGIATLGGSVPLPPGLVARGLHMRGRSTNAGSKGGPLGSPVVRVRERVGKLLT